MALAAIEAYPLVESWESEPQATTAKYNVVTTTRTRNLIVFIFGPCSSPVASPVSASIFPSVRLHHHRVKYGPG